jgi:hypothetical protein
MSVTPIKRQRLITMPGDDRQPPPPTRGPLGQVVVLGIARQRLRGVTGNRDMRYDLGPAS